MMLSNAHLPATWRVSTLSLTPDYDIRLFEKTRVTSTIIIYWVPHIQLLESASLAGLSHTEALCLIPDVTLIRLPSFERWVPV